MKAVVVGDFATEAWEILRLAALRAGAQATALRDFDQAREDVAAEPPRCVFVDACMPGVEAFVSWMRGEARLFSVPVVVMVPSIDDDVFLDAHSFGADDVITRGDEAGVTARLTHLAPFDPLARAPITQGRAVLAHPDPARRRVLGRVLRQGGFDLAFAADARELANMTTPEDPPALVVAHQSVPPAGVHEAVERFRARLTVPTVVLAAHESLPPLRRWAGTLGATELLEEHAPPDSLLFLANELLRPDVKNVRASTRLLYGTVCAFRGAGQLLPAYGLTYNISREGMFVRTLNAPERGTRMWIELRPCDRDEAVHLRGDVVWVRSLGSAAGGATPPGFGFRIDVQASPSADLRAYHAAYDERIGRRSAA